MLKNYKEWVAEHPDIAKLGNPTPLEIAAIEIPMPEPKKQLPINECEGLEEDPRRRRCFGKEIDREWSL